jgi:hypothetical protein
MYQKNLKNETKNVKKKLENRKRQKTKNYYTGLGRDEQS